MYHDIYHDISAAYPLGLSKHHMNHMNESHQMEIRTENTFDANENMLGGAVLKAPRT